jgi:hypothetical protein
MIGVFFCAGQPSGRVQDVRDSSTRERATTGTYPAAILPVIKRSYVFLLAFQVDTVKAT